MGKEKDQSKNTFAILLLTILTLVWKAVLIVLFAVIRFLVVFLNLIGERIETYLNIKKPK